MAMTMPAFCEVINITGATEESVRELLNQTQPVGYDFNGDGVISGLPSVPTIPTAPVATPTPTPKPEKKACEHDYVPEITKLATCAEEGETTYTCTLCKDTYTESIPKLTTHDYKEEITKSATCTEAGEATYTCSVCGDTYTEPIEAVGHQHVSELTTPPTCTEAGEVTYTCSVCGDTYAKESPATGHTEGEWEVSKDAGWFSVGEQVQKCTVCGEILATEVIPTQYPMWYLYTGIGAIAAIIIAIVAVIVLKKKKIKASNVAAEKNE